MRVPLKKRREGFTLVELLVVISIIAVLASLILPGVMNARRAARRAQCLNNMKQVGIGFVDYYTTNGTFPPSGRWDINEKTNATPPVARTQLEIANLYNTDLAAPANISTIADYTFTASTANPLPLEGMRYSWVREMLPRLDRSDIYDLWDTSAVTSFGTYLNTGNTTTGVVGPAGKRAPGGSNGLTNTDLRVIVCPEDITTQQGKGNLSYVVNGGFSFRPDMHPTGASSSAVATVLDTSVSLSRQASENLFRMGLMFLEGAKKGRRHTPESVKDGLTTTVMMSENVNAGYAQSIAYNNGTAIDEINWACPHPANTSFFVQTGTTDSTAQVLNAASATAPNVAANHYKYTLANTKGPTSGGINGDVTGLQEFNSPYPSSFHTGGVHIMMCDGGVRFMGDSIGGEIWARLVTPDGGRVLGTDDNGNSTPKLVQTFEDRATNPGNTQIPIKESDIP